MPDKLKSLQTVSSFPAVMLLSCRCYCCCYCCHRRCFGCCCILFLFSAILSFVLCPPQNLLFVKPLIVISVVSVIHHSTDNTCLHWSSSYDITIRHHYSLILRYCISRYLASSCTLSLSNTLSYLICSVWLVVWVFSIATFPKLQVLMFIFLTDCVSAQYCHNFYEKMGVSPCTFLLRYGNLSESGGGRETQA